MTRLFNLKHYIKKNYSADVYLDEFLKYLESRDWGDGCYTILSEYFHIDDEAGKFHITPIRVIREVVHGGKYDRGMISKRTCKNEKCCNPNHITFESRGGKVKKALSKEQEERVLNLHFKQRLSVDELSKRFGCSKTVIKTVIKNSI